MEKNDGHIHESTGALCMVAHGKNRGGCFRCKHCRQYIPTNKDGSIFTESLPAQSPDEISELTVGKLNSYNFKVVGLKSYHNKDSEKDLMKILKNVER